MPTFRVTNHWRPGEHPGPGIRIHPLPIRAPARSKTPGCSNSRCLAALAPLSRRPLLKTRLERGGGVLSRARGRFQGSRKQLRSAASPISQLHPEVPVFENTCNTRGCFQPFCSTILLFISPLSATCFSPGASRRCSRHSASSHPAGCCILTSRKANTSIGSKEM